jgi:DNA-binding beta-propeller fold protein YncE
VSNTTPIATPLSPRTGIHATLRASFGARGSGALSAGLGRVGLGLSALLWLALTVGFLAPSTASAAQAHRFSSAFGEAGPGAGQLALRAAEFQVPDPNHARALLDAGSGVAIDESSHDVYVADTDNHRVDEFSSTGAFILAWGFGVKDGAAKPEVCTSSCQAGLSGSAPGEFEAPIYIAVDNSSSLSVGDVYVADASTHLVQKFTASGTLVKTWGNHENASAEPEPNGQLTYPFFQAAPAGIAVDASGDLWLFVQDNRMYKSDEGGLVLTEVPHTSGNGESPSGIAVDPAGNPYMVNFFGEVEELNQSGTAIRGIPQSDIPRSLALDPATSTIYTDLGTSIATCDIATAVCPPAESFGSQLSSGAGVAVDPSSATVYAADAATDELDVFPVGLEATTAPATELKATTVTLNGEVNPRGGELSQCEFEYGTNSEYGTRVPCEQSFAAIGEGNSPVPVEAKIAGLEGGTAYHFRLVAKREAGLGEKLTALGADVEAQTLPIPVLSETAAGSITANSALLGAKVNPRGLEVLSCVFEYGTSTAYGTALPCQTEGGGPIGSGTAPVAIKAALSGLSPETTYHWRVVATDQNGSATTLDNTFVYQPTPLVETGCSNEAFRTGLSAALPDCRAYEQVSPAAKNGAVLGVIFASGIQEPDISADGSRVLGVSEQCFAGAESCTAVRASVGEAFGFTRSSSGWVTNPLAPPGSFSGNTALSVEADAGAALLTAPTPPLGEDDFYLRRTDGSLVDIGPVSETRIGPPKSEIRSFSADLSHFVFGVSPTGIGSSPIWAFDPTATDREDLYEYVGTGNTRPLLVGVEGPSGSNDLICREGTRLGGGRGGKVYGAVSTDGRVIYFSTGDCGPTAIYARIDGEIPGEAHTVPISVRSPSDCSGSCPSSVPADANFIGASSDGSKVYFTSTQQLTDDATEGANNLYLYDFSRPTGENLSDVSANPGGALAPVQRVMAISADGSHTYFLSKALLTEAPNAQGQRPAEGKENLYLYQRDAAFPEGHLSFVTTGSFPVESGRPSSNVADPLALARSTANVTPDGRYLVFLASGRLTPDDTAASAAAAQVFRYDATSEALQRLSIGQRGFNDDGNAGPAAARVGSGVVTSASIAEMKLFSSGRADPTMSNDGNFVFFESPLALTPGALDEVPVNGLGNLAQNIYEWEADGVRSCHEATGCISLISDGADISEVQNESSVRLLGTDASGDNVFFQTTDGLVASDTDGGLDYYDARLEGGFPATTTPTLCESSEACHAGTTAAGPQQAPATPLFNGPPEGAKNPEKCKKGLVRKGAKCVKATKGKHKKAKHKNSNKKNGRAAKTNRRAGK